jgi:hypothetical protein
MYVAFYMLQFSDGGNAEAVILHEGSEESCRKVADMFPGVTYSGPRPNPKASVNVCLKKTFEEWSRVSADIPN